LVKEVVMRMISASEKENIEQIVDLEKKIYNLNMVILINELNKADLFILKSLIRYMEKQKQDIRQRMT
jgi:hypothetical protein